MIPRNVYCGSAPLHRKADIMSELLNPLESWFWPSLSTQPEFSLLPIRRSLPITEKRLCRGKACGRWHFFCSCVFLVIVPGPNGHTLLGWQRGASRNTCSKGWVGELTYSYHDWKIHVKNVIHEILLSIYSVHLEQCAAGNYFPKGWVFTELYKTFEALKST